jgi:hypothetical protein
LYTSGKLIYFDPFHFSDGKGSSPKYFLVLKVIDDKEAILACLPSSKGHLPSEQPLNHGCLEIPSAGINCYILEAHKPILKNGWSFPLVTFLHGHWLADIAIETLKNTYPINGVDYEVIGDFDDQEFAAIIKCFSNSSIVKRKYKRLLTS